MLHLKVEQRRIQDLTQVGVQTYYFSHFPLKTTCNFKKIDQERVRVLSTPLDPPLLKLQTGFEPGISFLVPN